MPLAAVERMTADAFLAWLPGQARRHELVDGVPVAMAGAKRRHDQIVVNTLAELRNQLRGTECRAFSADTAVLIPGGNVRFSDAGVDCGTFKDEDVSADQPIIVIEVLSDSTRTFNLFGKLEEYKTVPSIWHIVLVNPDEPQAMHWFRNAQGAWFHEVLEGIEAMIEIRAPRLTLHLSDLYEGLLFRAKPHLIVT